MAYICYNIVLTFIFIKKGALIPKTIRSFANGSIYKTVNCTNFAFRHNWFVLSKKSVWTEQTKFTMFLHHHIVSELALFYLVLQVLIEIVASKFCNSCKCCNKKEVPTMTSISPQIISTSPGKNLLYCSQCTR